MHIHVFKIDTLMGSWLIEGGRMTTLKREKLENKPEEMDKIFLKKKNIMDYISIYIANELRGVLQKSWNLQGFETKKTC